MEYFVLSAIALFAAVFWYSGVFKKSQREPMTCDEVQKFTYWPIVLNKWNQNDNLRTMKRVLNRFGYQMVDGSEEHWDLMWSIEFPFDRFPHLIANLSMNRHQKMNHIPGSPSFSNKMLLSTRTESPFLLPGFQFPKNLEKFQNYVKENPDKQFLVKNFDNRGVKLLTREESNHQLEVEDDAKFIQVFLENPYLIDNHVFDIGIYILVASLDPLVIYRFKEECLLRFCAEPYHPFDPKNSNKYIISDTKKHAWQMDTFKHLEGHFDFFNIEILKNHLRKNGHDIVTLWKQFDEAVTSIIISKYKSLKKSFNRECEKYKCVNENLFELFRADFMLDDELGVHLLEINMSPNLTPSMKEFERNGLHYEHVVYNTLRLIGAEGFAEIRKDLRNFTSLQDIAVDVTQCDQCGEQCESQSCLLCVPCMTDDHIKMLQRFHRKHQRRGAFKRIFPTQENNDEEDLSELSEATKFLAYWLDAKCKGDGQWC